MPFVREVRVSKPKESTMFEIVEAIKAQEWLGLLETKFINVKKGCGLFTTVPIREGQFVLPYEGVWLKKAEAQVAENYLNQCGFSSSYILWVKVVSIFLLVEQKLPSCKL